MREKRDNRKRHSEKERKKERETELYMTDFSEWCVSIQIDEFNQCKGEIIAD